MKRRIVNATLAGLFLIASVMTSPVVFAASLTATVANGSGQAAGAPITMVPGENTVTVTQAGTFTVTLPSGQSGVAASGTSAITGSPVSLMAGVNSITAEGAGDFVVEWGYPAVTGIYTFHTNISLIGLDGFRLMSEGEMVYCRNGTLAIDTQTLGEITATLVLENIAADVPIELQGYIGKHGRLKRLYLYRPPPAEPSGNNFIVMVSGFVVCDRVGAVTGISGVQVSGMDMTAPDEVYEFYGQFNARRSISVP